MGELVSIGVPVFQAENYLDDALCSLRAQTHEDLEIVVVDNASTDRTADIAHEHANADDRVTVLHNETNLGASPNFNRAFTESRGEYFKWAAHDDTIRPSFVERCLDVLRSDPSVSLAYTVTDRVDENGKFTEQRIGGDYATDPDPVVRATDIVLDPTPCFEVFGLMRRHQLARTKLLGAYTSADRPLLAEMAIQGRYHEVEEALFVHRQHMGRSVHVAGGGQGRKLWFDPNASDRSSPVWRLGVEYRRAAARHLSVRERARFDAVLARWALRNRRNLAKETVVAAYRASRRPARPGSSPADSSPAAPERSGKQHPYGEIS